MNIVAVPRYFAVKNIRTEEFVKPQTKFGLAGSFAVLNCGDDLFRQGHTEVCIPKCLVRGVGANPDSS